MDETSQENAEEQAVPKATYEGKDAVLEALVYLVHKVGIGASVVLTVGGAIISGELITGQLYFEQQSEAMATGTYGGPNVTPEIARAVREFMVKVFEDQRVKYEVGVDAALASEDPLNFNYIHLQNATIFSGGTALIQGVLWRGRLEAVDGFIIGKPNL